MTQQTIVADQLKYAYDKTLAVDGISFDVAPGEIMGFLGPNGAGKSTTIKMLTGQLKPASGAASVLGMDVSRKPKDVQARIGICFEITNLYEQLSGAENLKLFARLYGIKDYDPQPVLERVGLPERGTDRAENYSKGMKQRLMVARALVHQPDVLFLDEPTGGLDPVSSDAIRNVIQEERERGATVFLTTHDMHEADRLSDRVAFINNGAIVALDTPHALKQQYGQRRLRAEVAGPDGKLTQREIVMDGPQTATEVQQLFAGEQVVTLHSEEASLEDIFIQITGRGLS